MNRPRSNRDLYAPADLAEVGTGRGLYPSERTLVDRYLSKDGDTLEAETGSGRILYALRDLGFTSLNGFDYDPEVVQAAREADTTGAFTFDVQEATNLGYADDQFDQVIYLQQLVSFIESEPGRAAAIRETYRVLRGGGIALISCLSWESRQRNTLVRVLGPWLRVQRWLRRSDRGPQDWPWMVIRGRFNYGALMDRGPYIHWFTRGEAQDLLEAMGFSIVFAGTETDVGSIGRGEVPDPHRPVDRSDVKLYFVCTK